MGIGSTLQELLTLRGTNVNELAKQINISPQTLYSIIRRDNMKVDIDVLARISECLHVNMEYFYNQSLDKKKFPELTEVSPGNDKNKQELLQIYDELNADGQTNMMTYAQFLSSQPQYKKCQDISDEKIG
nr:MAG TPA: helix-turn-helix domain protein [Caudoviricetes sp.]